MADESPVKYLKSPIGILKLASAGVGFLAMCFVAGGISAQSGFAIGGTKTGDVGDVQKILAPVLGIDYKKLGFFEKYQFWMGQIAATLIILTWLATLVVVVAIFIKPLNQLPIWPKIDAFGHLGFAIALFLGALLCVVYTANGAVASCDKKIGFARRHEDCTKFYLWELPGYGRGQASGFKFILFALAALLAIGHGVVCILICLKAMQGSKRGRAPVMMMGGGGVSQAPTNTSGGAAPSQSPSQAGQQSQKPPSAQPSQATEA